MSVSMASGGGWICGSTSRGARVRVSGVRREGCKVHDTEQKTWRHLDFFQHEAYLTARVPRVICPEHEVQQVQVPWARERSGFTLLFEALVMALVKEMPVAAVAGLIGEHDMRIWRIVHHYVDRRRGARISPALSGWVSMRPAPGAGRTTCRCSPIWTSAARCS